MILPRTLLAISWFAASLLVALPTVRAQEQLGALHGAAVTPSDTVNLTAASTWLAFSNSGAQTLQVTMVGGETVTMTLPSGMWPIRARRVWSTVRPSRTSWNFGSER